jgi:hypothetical protein
MKSELLKGNIEGQLVVTRETGGTLFSDHASDGGFIADQRVAQSRAAHGSLRARMMKARVEPTGLPCSCTNGGTYQRGAAPDAPCITCGGDRA